MFAERFVHHLDILMRQYHSELLLITNYKHHNSLYQDGTNRNEEEEGSHSELDGCEKARSHYYPCPTLRLQKGSGILSLATSRKQQVGKWFSYNLNSDANLNLKDYLTPRMS